MNTVIKVEYGGDLRRALLKGTPAYADIDRAIQEIWPGHCADGAKYVDEEGDACTLKERTFPDFLATAQTGANGNTLRLKLADPVEAQPAAESSSIPSATEAFTRPWEHVEQGSEAGEENLHTVADLTDSPEEAAVLQESVEAAADVKAEQSEAAQEEASSSVDEAVGRPRVHSIHTPTNSPRNQAGEAPDETHTAGYPQATSCDANKSAQPAEASESSGLVIDHDMEEKIDLILAAFDENVDGHLNFAESNALFNAAGDAQLSLEVFQQMCAEEGEDPEVGLGRESLMCMYSRCRTLERDFEAAKAKLEAIPPEERRRRQRREREAKANPMDLVFKNPLLAVPFALDATERIRQKAAGALTRKR